LSLKGLKTLFERFPIVENRNDNAESWPRVGILIALNHGPFGYYSELNLESSRISHSIAESKFVHRYFGYDLGAYGAYTISFLILPVRMIELPETVFDGFL
jgi:hypothetical protein